MLLNLFKTHQQIAALECNTRNGLAGAFAVICSLMPAVAAADTLELKDGSRLVGTLVRMEADKLVFKTGFSGDLEIQRSNVASVSTDKPVSVDLKDGSRLIGTLRGGVGGAQYINTKLVGQVRVDPAQLTAAWEPGDKAPEQIALEAAEAKHQKQVETLQLKALSGDEAWTGKFELGLSGSEGNTKAQKFDAKIAAHRKSEFDRLDLSLQGRSASDEEGQTESEVIAKAKLERDFSDRWFAFGASSFERDKFEDIDLRTSLTTGVGYFAIKKPTQEWKPRAGLGYLYEAYKSSPDEGSFVLDLGFDYWVNAGGQLKFSHTLNYLPSLEDPGADYRLESEAAVAYPLSKDKAWNIIFSLRHEFDALPAPDVDKLDTYYKVGLGYDFD